MGGKTGVLEGVGEREAEDCEAVYSVVGVPVWLMCQVHFNTRLPRYAARLDEFEARWGKRYPAVVPAWWRAWDHVVPMFAFPPAIRKMIYTTNALCLYYG